MKRLLAASILWLGQSLAQSPAPALSQVIQTYCVGCHSQNDSKAGISFDQLHWDRVAADPGSWEKVLRQLRARTMPPVGAQRPDRASYEAIISTIAEALDRGYQQREQATATEIASRLADLLWNAAPDQPLLDAVRSGRLMDSVALEQQIRRMLADPKAKALVTGFFDPWLELDQLAKINPEPGFFPDFDEPLRQDLLSETEMFIADQLREDADVLSLWSADYTYVNPRLARHYGIPNVSGPEFRRIAFAGPERAGLLGQGSILTITSHTETSTVMGEPAASPASRGKWIRKHFFGINTPPPFPNTFSRQKGMPLSKQTRSLPASPCTNCHRNFFPMGYGLEHFDPLGRWRTADGSDPIDATGAMVDGTAFNGSAELRRALLERGDAFRTTLTERLLTYSLKGRPGINQPTAPETMPIVRSILREAAAGNYRWSALIAGIVRRAPPFQGR